MAHIQLSHLLLGMTRRVSQGLEYQEHRRFKMLIEAFYLSGAGDLCAQEHEAVFFPRILCC